MIKKLIPLIVILMWCGGYTFAFEVGLTGGSMSKSSDSGFHYGLAAGTGFLIPMVKFEFEWYKMKDTEFLDKPNTVSVGVKFRPKFGKFAPYAIIGVGGEFDRLNFDFGDYDKFTFIGGGCHFFAAHMVSIRADLRFLNFSDINKTRFSAGVFIHI